MSICSQAAAAGIVGVIAPAGAAIGAAIKAIKVRKRNSQCMVTLGSHPPGRGQDTARSARSSNCISSAALVGGIAVQATMRSLPLRGA